MNYVALLRGINVGGNNIIKMADLKAEFEKAGYTGVITFIQSGNVIFNSGLQDKAKIVEHLETVLSKAFSYTSKVVIRSHKEMRTVISGVPNTWIKENDLRCYITYVREPVTVEEVASQVEIRDDIDSLHTGPGVLYMSTKMEGITKSNFSKFIGKKSYKDVTIRNFKTSRIILEIMDAK